jgi:hypothetical protein
MRTEDPGEVQRAAIARHLHIERKVLAEAVLPLHLEAQEIDVEFARLLDVEDAQDGRDRAEGGHGDDP